MPAVPGFAPAGTVDIGLFVLGNVRVLAEGPAAALLGADLEMET